MSALPKPDIAAHNAAFWEGAAAGELRIRHCGSCGAVFRFAHVWCPVCWAPKPGWKVASGRGKVATFSVVHTPPSPAFAASVPYVLALVDLEEGVRMMSNVVGCDPQAVRIGMAVSVRFEDRDGVALPQFQPVTGT